MYILIYKDRDRRASLAGIAVVAFCKGSLRASVWAVHIIFPKPDNTKHYIYIYIFFRCTQIYKHRDPWASLAGIAVVAFL